MAAGMEYLCKFWRICLEDGAGLTYAVIVEQDLIVIRVFGRSKIDIFPRYALQKVEGISK